MTMDPISVWGARSPSPQEVAALEEHQLELSPDDMIRRQTDRNRVLKMKPGSYSVEGNKFAPAPQFAALYRGDGTLAPVPLATYQYYLRKRDKDGRRIFFVSPPCPPPQLTSDPCPVSTSGVVCGVRMLDQYELVMHIMKKHQDRAFFYLSQAQRDMATGKVDNMLQRMLGERIGNEPTAPPTAPLENPNVVRLSTVVRESARQRDEQVVEKDVDLIEVEEVTTVPVAYKKRSNNLTPHSCKYGGRLGKYDDACIRCQEILAERVSGGGVKIVDGGDVIGDPLLET